MAFGPGALNYAIKSTGGGTLQLGNGPNSATMTVAAGNQTISAPVLLTSNLVVSPAAGSQMTISGGVAGLASRSWSTIGDGSLDNADSYTGGTTVSVGTFVLADPSAIAANTSLTIGAGGTLRFDPTLDAIHRALVVTTPVSSESSDLRHKKDVAIQVLDAMFAQYGRLDLVV